MQTITRKIFVTAPNVVEFQTCNEPVEIADADEIILRNLVSHISNGTESACLKGIEGWFKIPAVPGYTAIAEILEVGAKVTRHKPGDIVYTYGPHQEVFKINQTDRFHGICTKVPEGANLELAAFTHMATIAFTAIRKARIELGDDVLVSGLGTIGNMAAQLAQLQGGRVIAFDISDRRLDLARQCGLRNLINNKTRSLAEGIAEYTQGRGVTTLIDATGLSRVIEEAAEHVTTNGEIILLGSPRAPYETNLTPFLQRFHLMPQFLELRGALEFSIPTHRDEFVKHSIERNAEMILDFINDGSLKIQPIYTHKFSPTEAAKAYAGIRENPDDYIGILFDWR